MAGIIKQMIDEIIDKRAGRSVVLRRTTKTKLILKGINIDDFDEKSQDDQEVIEKLREMAAELHIELNSNY